MKNIDRLNKEFELHVIKMCFLWQIDKLKEAYNVFDNYNHLDSGKSQLFSANLAPFCKFGVLYF